MNETSKRYLAFHTPQGNLLGEIRMPERPVALVLMLRADNAVADREQASRLFAQGCAVMSIDLLTSDEARFADNRQNIPKHVARILDLLDLCRRDAEFADLPLILLAETDACPAALRAAMQRDQQVRGVICKGGGIDTAGVSVLQQLTAPLLVLNPAQAPAVIETNERAARYLRCPHELRVSLPGEPALQQVERWLSRRLEAIRQETGIPGS